MAAEAGPTRGRLARLGRIQYRLLTFALARLRHRRTAALLASGGVAIALAMLTLTLVVERAVEDRTFANDLRAAAQSGVVVGTPITANAASVRRKVTEQMALDHVTFQPSAGFNTPDRSWLVMETNPATDFELDRGRLPRLCTRDRCEYVSTEGSVVTGTIAGGAGGAVRLPGYHAVRVGVVHVKPNALEVGVRNQRVAVVSGFRLLRDRRTIGQGGLFWSAPFSSIVRHPWDVDRSVERIARLRSDLARVANPLFVDSPFDQLQSAKSDAATAGRRLLVVCGAMVGVFLAFLVLVATRLRGDADLLSERLAIANASRSQIRLLTLFEYAVTTVVGVLAGVVVGLIAGAALAERLGAGGVDSALHVAASSRSWLVWTAAGAAAVAVFLVVIWGRTRRLAEIGAAIAAAALVAGFLNGGLDAGRIGHANAGVIAFVILAPALAVAVVAVAGARVFRPLLLLFARVAPRLGTSTRLAALSVARRPGDAAVLVAFVGATLGLALFLAAYRTTLDRSQRDQIAYATPADVLVSEDLRALVPVNTVPLTRFPGERKLRVMRATGEIPQLDNGGLTVIGIPAGDLGTLQGWRKDFSDLGLNELGRRLQPTSNVAFRAVPLPANRTVVTFPIKASGGPLDVSATLLAPTGDFQEVEIGDTHDALLRLVVPKRFRGGSLVGFSFAPGDTGLHLNQNAGETADQVALGSLRLGPVGWADFRHFRGVNGVAAHPSRHVIRIRYAVGTDAVARLRLKQPTDGRLVNVAVSPDLAQAAGARGVLPIDILGTQVAARVVAVVKHFPTVEGNVVVADQQWIATALNAAEPGPPFYNEVWIDDRQPQRVQRGLARPPFLGLSVVSRRSVAQASTSSTIVRAARDLYLIGGLVAAALAVLGMALAAAADIRSRRWEIVDLRAQGADRRWLGGFIRRRLVISCVFGALIAVVAGTALLFATVSLLRIGADIRQADPPVRMSVTWTAVAAAALVVACLTGLVVSALARGQLREIGGSRT